MNVLHLPWLELSIVIPLAGAAWVARLRDSERARRHAVFVAAVTLLCAVGAWQDFNAMHVADAHDPVPLGRLLGDNVLVVDALSAPLLPLTALLYLATFFATLPTKVRRFSFSGSLVSESLLLATLSCKNPWAIAGLLAVRIVPIILELRSRRRPVRVFALHMGLFVGLMFAGLALVESQGAGSTVFLVGVILLMAAVLIRSGVCPLHCWMTDLFEHASFGTALLFVTPMIGAYAAVRLVLPIAPDWVLRSIGLVSLFTAVYAAGMALVQREARRFFCYLFLSHSSLVLVGLEVATPIGLTGALSLWLSVGLALAGFGLTLRSMESRIGRLSLADYHGLYEHTPALAAFFLLTGLASVGFPGTFGFVGTELLLEGAVDTYPYVGTAVVLAAALNGIAVVQTYFKVFTGGQHRASISLRSRIPEKVAVLTLALLILGGGVFPQPGISSRHHAAMELVKTRQIAALDSDEEESKDHPTEDKPQLGVPAEMNSGRR